MFTNKFNTIINSLKNKAATSDITSQLAATIFKGKQPLSNICCNTERTKCRNYTCGSLHAEANAILDYYGSDLSWNVKTGWHLPYIKGAKRKGEEE